MDYRQDADNTQDLSARFEQWLNEVLIEALSLWREQVF
jgi:hypothetical protein